MRCQDSAAFLSKYVTCDVRGYISEGSKVNRNVPCLSAV